MGAILSKNSSRYYPVEASDSGTSKRQRLSSSCYEDDPRLIPGLPDEISLLILARLPRIYYLNIKLVSRAWKAATTSAELYALRKELATTEEWLYILTKVGNCKLSWVAFDSVSKRWQRLPPMPHAAFEDEPRRGLSALNMLNVMGSGKKFVSDTIRGWLGRKDALDRMPFCGCSVGAVDGCLYVIGGFSKSSAVKHVWRYDPVFNVWSEASSLLFGRAYCKTGILNNKLYVVGGVTRGRGGLTPLQSAEVFDPKTDVWSQIPSMPFSKAQVLPAGFLADLLKPIATGMTPYRGRLFVPQSLYCWPFFVDVGGEAYEPETGSWTEMPTGMGEGWPARQAGTKLSVTVDEELYALDPSGSAGSARIKVYDSHEDAWKVVLEDVPIPDVTESESPYLLAGLLGKLHIITKDANNNITVLQANMQNVLGSFLSGSSSPSDGLFDGNAEIAANPVIDTWKVLGARSAGSAELVSCQTLEI